MWAINALLLLQASIVAYTKLIHFLIWTQRQFSMLVKKLSYKLQVSTRTSASYPDSMGIVGKLISEAWEQTFYALDP